MSVKQRNNDYFPNKRGCYFVAGTDTGVGKTLVTSALLCLARQQGYRTLALKPVAAGCDESPQGLRNQDALILSRCMTEPLPYDQLNPVALKAPLSPHIAAQMESRSVSVSEVVDPCLRSLLKPVDMVLVEGAGGWRVPLNANETMANLCQALELPVVLVVGVKLGCINHSLLTAEAVIRDGVKLAGWVANTLDPDLEGVDALIETLKIRLPGECYGVVPFIRDVSPEKASGYLSLPQT